MSKAALLLHGYATTKDDFKSLIPAITPYYDTIVNENYPGHGGTDHLKNFNAIDTVMWCYEQARKVTEEYDEVDLYGFSMGGALASYLATQFHFRKVILLAPANKFINIRMEFSRIKLHTSYLIASLKKEDVKLGASSLRDVREAMKENDKKSMEMGLKVLLPNYTAKSISEFMSIIKYCNSKIEGKTCDTPTLMQWGTVDQLVPKVTLKYLEEIFVNSEIKILPGISHLMLASKNNQEIIENILDFIKEDTENECEPN